MEVVLFLLYFAATIAAAGGAWKVFEKAGKPGWAALVPVYNAVVLVEIVGKPVWWAVMLFLPCAQVPVFAIVVYIEGAQRLVESVASWVGGFRLGLALTGLLLVPMLVVAVLVGIELAKKFGKDTRFGVGLALLPPVFFPMLGFGDGQFEGGTRLRRVTYND